MDMEYIISQMEYERQFKEDIFYGYGVLYFSNGDKHEGEFTNDKKDVYGVYHFSNGDRYEGKL